MTVQRFIFKTDYDSQLGFPNEDNETDFTLKVKLYFGQRNPIGGDIERDYRGGVEGGDTLEIRRWDDATWDAFKQEVKSEVERHLNWPQMSLALMPQQRPHNRMSHIQYLWFVHKKQKPTPAIVKCGVTLEFVDDPTVAHVIFLEVVRLTEKNQDTIGWVNRDSIGRHVGVLSNRFVESWLTKHGISQSYVTQLIGEVLGLTELAPLADSPEARNWMGWGNEVTTANKSPWSNRIRLHASGLEWLAISISQVKGW